MVAAPEDIQRHYRSANLLERILAGLQALGKDLDALTHDDLAPADEFHSGGRTTTRELARLGEISRGAEVLDVGSGLGGPARFLAAEYGCTVTGIDLMPEFCDVANALSKCVRLDDRTRFQAGSALDMPFPDASFDFVWTVQMQMNIADKARLYAEMARVLRPGGRLVFQEVCEGTGEALHYPVPWASEPALSYLATPEALRKLVQGAGLRERYWMDVTDEVVAWRKSQAAKMAQSRTDGNSPPPLGMHLVMGDRAAEKMANSARNAEEGRIRSIQGVYERPG